MTEVQQRDDGREKIPVTAYNAQVGTKWTFENPKVRNWVESRLRGRVLNACAGQTRLDYDGEIVTNDLDPDIPTDYTMRVRDLPDELGESHFDTIIYDPPWSVFQSNEEYEGRMVGTDRIMSEAIARLLRGDGRVLGFGYQSTIMPARLGFRCEEIAVFRLKGRLKDFFGVRDERVNHAIDDWSTGGDTDG